jgi:hypothetical protein
MLRCTTTWLLFVAFVSLSGTLGCSDAANHDWPERADPETGGALQLTPETQSIKAGQSPHFTVTLVNGGKNEVVLVEAGDGSGCGWRTPLVEWSPRQRCGGRRCGNINALKPEEVFTLRPAESRELKGWLGEPYLPNPGRYRVALRYSNEPQREWFGVPLGEHDPKAWALVRRSTPVTVVSNAVEVVVE